MLGLLRLVKVRLAGGMLFLRPLLRTFSIPHHSRYSYPPVLLADSYPFAMRITLSTKKNLTASGKELVLSKSGSIHGLKIRGLNGPPCGTPAVDIAVSVSHRPCVRRAVGASNADIWDRKFVDIFSFNNFSSFRLGTVSYALLRSRTST